MSEDTQIEDVIDDPVIDDVVETPEAEETQQAEVETVELARVRAAAEAQGWRPEGKLGPVEFLEAIPKYSEQLVQKLRDLEAKNEKLFRAVGQQISAADAAAKAKAEADLQEATERGDYEAAKRAAAELHKPVQTLDEVPTDAQSKVKAWTEQPEQHWFRSDPKMAAKAAALYDGEMRALGRDDPETILPLVEAEIRALFPHKFVNPNRDRGTAATATTASRTTQQTSRRAPTSEGLIDPTIRAQYLKMGLTEAEIVKSLEIAKRVY